MFISLIFDFEETMDDDNYTSYDYDSHYDHYDHYDHNDHYNHNDHYDHNDNNDHHSHHDSNDDHHQQDDHNCHNHDDGHDHDKDHKRKDEESGFSAEDVEAAILLAQAAFARTRSDSSENLSENLSESKKNKSRKTKKKSKGTIPVRAAIVRHSGSGNDPNDDLDSPIEGLTEGVLEIRTLFAESANKEIWQRPPEKDVPSSSSASLLLNFNINCAKIMPPDNENVSNVKKYIIYELCVKQQTLKQPDSTPATIERRYTDFLTLYENLKKDHNQLMQNVAFPRKVLMGNFSHNLIAERSTAFEALLYHIVKSSFLRDSPHFLSFLQDQELEMACRLLDERRNEQAVPILENCFVLLNKLFMDRSKPVLLMLCRLVAGCTSSPLPHPSADKWAELALRRYEGVCDADLLVLYIPLLHTCAHLWWQLGRDNKLITERLTDMSKKGIKITDGPSLTQAIHTLDPRGETI